MKKYRFLLETDADISGSGEGAVMVPRYHDHDVMELIYQ
jgi:hypothetical protein